MDRSRGFITAFALLAGPVAFAVACYGPTEVIVDISTDLRCGSSPSGDAPRTSIYRGEPGRYETTPEAETDACEPGPGDAHIGTLSFVPSGSRDGRAAVRVVVARYPKTSAAECEGASTEHCIYATRSFSFVSHESRRLPIRLSRDCIGIRCAVGQTCVAGACVGDDVSCQGDACILPPTADAGLDGSLLDGSLDASIGRCLAPDGSDVLVSVKAPLLFASSPTMHAWVEADGTTLRVRGIPRMGGATTQLFESQASDPAALALDGEAVVLGYTNGIGLSVVRVGANDVPVTRSGALGLFVASGEVPHRVYAGSDKGIFEIVDKEPVAVSEIGSSSFFAEGTRLWIATGDGIYFADWASDQKATLIPQSPGGARMSGAAGAAGGLFAGGVATGPSLGRGLLARIDGNVAHTLETRRVSSPDEIASDLTDIYWREGESLFRRSKVVAGVFAVATKRGKPAHISVDPEPNGCLYYWSEGSLIVQSKVPLAKLDASIGPEPSP